MKRRAARDARAGEDPSLTQTTARKGLEWGSIIIIDIDKMEDIVRERGWSEYKPNEATGLLSNLIEDFVRKHHAVVIYGLDWERGTEETILELPLTKPEELIEDLIRISKQMCEEAGVSVTIVVDEGPVGLKPVGSRRLAYMGPRGRVKKLLDSIKRRGGGIVLVRDEEVYTSPCRKT